MDNQNETKEQRFVRLAEPRVSKACIAISRLANLANRSNYGYTDVQIDRMFAAIEREVEIAKAAFRKDKDSKQFRF